ncbi:unnamed protein product, partial [Urochloa humidicola]
FPIAFVSRDGCGGERSTAPAASAPAALSLPHPDPPFQRTRSDFPAPFSIPFVPLTDSFRFRSRVRAGVARSTAATVSRGWPAAAAARSRLSRRQLATRHDLKVSGGARCPSSPHLDAGRDDAEKERVM